jgi:O-antigen/teichoic acid export membrane protein
MIPSREQAVERARATSRAQRDRLMAHLRTPLFRTAYALMLSNVLTSAVGLLYWLAAARLYPTATVGRDSALIATMMLLAGIAQLNQRSALNRFLPEAGRGAGGLIARAYLVTVPATVVVVVGFAATASVLRLDSPVAGMPGDPAALAAYTLAVGTWALFNMQDGVLTGLGRALLVPVENALYALAKLALLVALVALPALSSPIFASWTVPAFVAVVALTLLVYRRLLPRRPSSPVDRPDLGYRDIVRFVAGDYVGALLVLAYMSLLPVITLAVVGTEAGATFYVVWVIATSLNLLPLSLSISHTVETVSAGSDPMVEARRVLVHMARTLVPVVAAVLLLAPVILSLFGPRYAAEGTDLLRLLAVGVLPYAVNVLWFSLARVHTRVAAIAIAQGILAGAILGLSLLLLPRMGMNGVGVAWLVSQGALAAWVLAGPLRPALTREVGSAPR